METHNSVIPDDASKKVDMCCCDLHAANDIIPASVSSVQYVAVNSIGKKSHSYEVNSLSASQEICHILWNWMFIIVFTCPYPKPDESSIYPHILFL